MSSHLNNILAETKETLNKSPSQVIIEGRITKGDLKE